MDHERCAQQSLDSVLARSASKAPGHAALVCGSLRLTYAMLADAVTRKANDMRQSGLGRGDRVVVFLENGIDMVVVLFAVWQLQAVCVTVNAQTKADKLAHIVRSVQACLIVTQRSLAAAWRGLDGEVSISIAEDDSQTVLDAHRPFSLGTKIGLDTAPAGLALISHTSGTTATPKGVMLSHVNLLTSLASIRAYLGIRADDILFSALPLSFNYGLTQLLLAVDACATLVLERSFMFPTQVIERMASEQATVFAGVPMMYAAMLASDSLNQRDLSRVRILTNASAALPVDRVRALRARFPDAGLFLMYGQTECTRISFLAPDEVDRHPDSVGRGLPEQRHWLIDACGKTVAAGGVGELVVQGEHVMLGYWGEAPFTDAASESAERANVGRFDRVHHTGDLFRTDRDGRLYFVARKDDIIKTRGEKVSPLEVETAIREIDGVAECVVAGVVDTLMGEAVCAWVVPCAHAVLVERDIIRHCLARLESYMAPKHVVFVDAFVRTANGKVRKADLPGIPALARRPS